MKLATRDKSVARMPWLRDGAGLALLVLATLGFFWRVVSGENWMPADGGDLVSFLYPTYRWAAATLQDGLWPLWNPGLYAGAPHVGDIQAGFLYPPNLALFLLWPNFPYQALQWLSIGHIWFAGAGMYLLLARGHKTGRLPACAGALAFMFSDALVVHFGNLNLNAAASWLPWVLWAYGSSLAQIAKRVASAASILGRAALAGLLLALSTFAGHIQVTLFILLALAIYTSAWAFLRRQEADAIRSVGWAILALALTTTLMVLVTAPVLLPSLELSAYTQRVDWDYTATAGFSLSPIQMIGWLVPGFFGRGPQFHWGAWPRVEVGYLGVLPLVLAGAAILIRRDRAIWKWVWLALVSLALAFGIYAIPHGWLTLLPGFGLLRAPARFVLLTDFAVAALAAHGLHALLQSDRRAGSAGLATLRRVMWRATGAVWVVVVPLAYLSILLTQDRDPTVVLRVSIAAIALITFAGLLAASAVWLKALRDGWAHTRTLAWLGVLLILLDLASLGAYQDLGDRNPAVSFEQPAVAAFLTAQPGPFRIDARTGIDSLWQPDTALLHGLEDVGGLANPLLLADTARYWDGLGSRSSSLYDLLNVRYVIAGKDVTLDWEKFDLAFADDPQLNVYRNQRALPRAFLVSEMVAVESHEAAWAAIHTPDFDPARRVVVEIAPPAVSQLGSGNCEIVRSAPGLLEVATRTRGSTWLVVSQNWYPGWRVALDGVDIGTPIRANYAFQGVAVPEGDHQITLRYEPPLWRVGWLLSGGALLLLSVATALAYSAGRNHNEGPATRRRQSPAMEGSDHAV